MLSKQHFNVNSMPNLKKTQKSDSRFMLKNIAATLSALPGMV